MYSFAIIIIISLVTGDISVKSDDASLREATFTASLTVPRIKQSSRAAQWEHCELPSGGGGRLTNKDLSEILMTFRMVLLNY